MDEAKKASKVTLQKALGPYEDEGRFVIDPISRLANQKALGLVSEVR